MLVSIIIASRNEGLLCRTVDSIQRAKNAAGYELIVVDDGSEDGSADFLDAGAYRSVKRLRTAGIGLAKARNAGAALAEGDILIFCDAHIVTPDYWIDGLTAVILDGRADAACPCIEGLSALERIGLARTAPSYPKRMCGKTIASLTESRWLPVQERPFEVPVLPGGCFAATRAAFEAVGGYDDGLKTYGWDEEEISIKLWTFGYTLMAVPQVTIYHHFRLVMPYAVPSLEVLYNLIHMAMCHYNDRRVSDLMAAVRPIYPKSQALYEEAFREEYLQSKRALYRSRRLHDDDWFFDRFGLEV